MNLIYSAETSKKRHASNKKLAVKHAPAVLKILQPRMQTGQSNDKYESQADLIAYNIEHKIPATPEVNKIHRFISHDGLTQSRPDKSNTSNEQINFESGLRSSANTGEPMSSNIKSEMEAGFGSNFSNIKIHNNNSSHSLTERLNALAFTQGKDIYFNKNQYNPSSAKGKNLLAHELTHTLQQAGSSVLQRREDPDTRRRRINYNAAAPAAPMGPFPAPSPSSFDPLSASLRAERTTHGLSTDSGPVVSQIESVLFPTGGSSGISCLAPPANFEQTVATQINTELRSQIPLSPVDAPDPMPIASLCADEAMPLINSYYSPFAPSVSAATFMASVSRKPTTYGDTIRTNDDMFAEFLEWFAGNEDPVYNLIADKCGIDTSWWESTFVPWLSASGSSFLTGTNRMRERSALYDTFNTSTTQAGNIEFGRAFELSEIPHTVLHEAMHKFTHANFNSQIRRMQQVRSSTDILSEGFTEYLARALTDRLVTAIQAHSPAPLSSTEEAAARVTTGYDRYFTKTVELRDILFSHDQDGEEAIQRAYFLGEGWRFGLLENSTGKGSPIEMQRSIPSTVNIPFTRQTSTLPSTATTLLQPVVQYLLSRSHATVTIRGSTPDYWSIFWIGTNNELALSVTRANAVKAHLISQGIDTSRINTTTIPVLSSTVDNASVDVIDDRNLTP